MVIVDSSLFLDRREQATTHIRFYSVFYKILQAAPAFKFESQLRSCKLAGGAYQAYFDMVRMAQALGNRRGPNFKTVCA